MTPSDLRTARKALGLTQHGLAEALGMGKWGFQTIAAMEKGETDIRTITALAVEALLYRAGLQR